MRTKQQKMAYILGFICRDIAQVVPEPAVVHKIRIDPSHKLEHPSVQFLSAILESNSFGYFLTPQRNGRQDRH